MQKQNKSKDMPIKFKVKKYKHATNLKEFWRHFRLYPYRIFMIMHQSNGGMDCKFVYHEDFKFVYQGGVYIIDRNFLKWSDSLNAFVGMWFQESSLPVTLTINVDSMIENIRDDLSGTHVEENVNPQTLYHVVNSQVIQKVMKGEELEKLLNLLKILGIVTMGVVVVILIILFAKVM